MTEAAVPAEKRTRVRYAGTSRLCACDLPQGAHAVYREVHEGSLVCVLLEPVPAQEVGPIPAVIEPLVEVDPGVCGASARQEFERCAGGNSTRFRAVCGPSRAGDPTKHKRLAGLIFAVSDDPQSTRAWDTRAIGEERLRDRLNELAGDSLQVLHDRKIPRSSANVDLAMTRTVFLSWMRSATADVRP